MNLPVARLMPLTLSLLLTASASVAEDKVNFEDHVKPIFRAKCASCHNTNKKTADLDLTNYTALMQGGGSGPCVEPGSPDDSYLFMVINHDSEPYMPPNSDKLPDPMVETVRKWIELGAPETSSSKVMLPKKPAVDLSVNVSAGARPEGPPPLPDVLGLEPVVHTTATNAVSAIATSPWAKLVAVAGQKQVILYSSETLQPLGVLPFPEGQARVLKFSRNGALLLAGGGHGAANGLAVVWNVKTGERVMQVGEELDEVLAADISADQSMIALAGPSKIVRVFSTVSGELQYEIVKHTDWVYSLEFSPDSVLLATGDRVGGLHVWEAYTGRPYLTLNGHKGGINSVSWRIDSNVLASASKDASVKLWEMENGKNIKSWNAHGGGTSSMEFCRDGRVVTCGRDRTTKIWDQNGKQLRAFEAFGDLALRVTHCDETDRVVAGDWTGEIRVWAAADGKRIGNLSTNPPPLQERLAAAEAAVAPLNQTLTAARAALNAANAGRTSQVKVIETAKQGYAAAQKTLTDRQATLKSQETQLTATQKKQTDSQARLAKLQKAIPELKAAAEKAGMASTMVSEDAELKKLVEQLKAQVAQRETEMTQVDGQVKAFTAEVTKYSQTVAATKKQITADQKAVTDSKAGLDAQTAALKPHDEKVAAAQTSLNAAQNAVNVASTEVDRWKHYVALRDELAAFRAKKTKKDEVLLASLEADALLKEKQQEISGQQSTMHQQQQLITDSTQKKTDAGKVIADTQKKITTVTDLMNRHQKAIPMLQAAAEQLRQAAAALPTDEGLKSSAASVASAVTQKTAELEKLKQDMATAKKTVQDSQALVKNLDTQIAGAKQAMDTAKQMVTKLTAEAKPIQESATAAKNLLAAAEAELKQAEAIVEARREKLRPQLQVTQAASN